MYDEEKLAHKKKKKKTKMDKKKKEKKKKKKKKKDVEKFLKKIHSYFFMNFKRIQIFIIT